MACSLRHRWCGHVKVGDTGRKTAQIMWKSRACCLPQARRANGWRRKRPLIPRERKGAWRSCAEQRKHREYFVRSRATRRKSPQVVINAVTGNSKSAQCPITRLIGSWPIPTCAVVLFSLGVHGLRQHPRMWRAVAAILFSLIIGWMLALAGLLVGMYLWSHFGPPTSDPDETDAYRCGLALGGIMAICGAGGLMWKLWPRRVLRHRA